MKKLRLGWNPIIIKELRSRMRGARAFIILTAFLLLLGLVSYGLYRIMAATSGRYGGRPLLSAHVGQAIFTALAFFELLLVCFITPALTAGIISGERERLTYDMLLATPLRPHSVLWGKFISALVYVLLLIFAAVPMASLVFIFGGVAPEDLVGVLIILLTTAVTFGAVGLFFSALLGRTVRATVITYAVIIALIAVTSLVPMAWSIVREQEPPRALLYPSPFAAMVSALNVTEPGPAWEGPQMLLLMPFMLPFGFFGFGRGIGMQQAGAELRPIWQYTVGLYIGLTLLCYLLSTQLVKPVRRWKIGWRGALLLALILLLYGGGAYGFYRQDGLAAWTAPPAPPTPAPVREIAVQRVVEVPVKIPPPPIPTPPVSLPPTPTPSLSEDNQAAIYAVVVRQLYTVAQSIGQPPDSLVVYLLQATQDGTVDPRAPYAETRLLPESVQTATIATLSDMPAEFLWHAPPEGDTGAVVNLGNVHLQEDDTVVVSASLYSPRLGIIGQIYILKQVDGVWQVVGGTGDNE